MQIGLLNLHLFSGPKTVYLEALMYLDFFGPNPLDFKRLTFHSFVRGFYFLLCNKRPVCGKTELEFFF